MALPTALLAKVLGGLGMVAAATLGGVGLKGLMEEKIDSPREGKIPSKTELTEEQKTLVKNVKVPERCKYPNEICELTIEELKLINFSNKQENQELTVTQNNVKVSLTITNLSEKEKEAFNNKSIKFNFKVSNSNLDIKYGNNDDNKISLLQNTNYEFKINDQSKLERAWSSGVEMAKKVGLNKCNDVGNKKSLPVWESVGDRKAINILTEQGERKTGLKVVNNQKSLNLELNEGQEGFNNGFKYSTPEEIQFENQTVKLEANKGYEIKFIEDDWYLSKVVESVSGGKQ